MSTPNLLSGIIAHFLACRSRCTRRCSGSSRGRRWRTGASSARRVALRKLGVSQEPRAGPPATPTFLIIYKSLLVIVRK
eukprot:617124-Prorocentrum_minimum.AAC.1